MSKTEQIPDLCASILAHEGEPSRCEKSHSKIDLKREVIVAGKGPKGVLQPHRIVTVFHSRFKPFEPAKSSTEPFG